LNKTIILSGLLFLVSFLLTYFYRYLALRHKVLDIPNERSSHQIPTPKGGGLAIVVTWYIGITCLYYLGDLNANLYLALMSGIIIAIVSYVDDLIELKPSVRLAVHLISAGLAIFFLEGIKPLHLGKFEVAQMILLIPLVLFGIIWFVNLFNFLDGIDGYASLEASTIALIMFLITGNIICLILLVSTLGFLSWNWPKARIFMGDVGSTQLGFVLVVLGLYFHNESALSLTQWIMLTSLFWFDATLTLFRRWRNGEKLSIAHRKHIYQRAVQSGLSHQKTILFSALINALIIGLVFISLLFKGLLLPVFILNILLLYLITLKVDSRVPFK